MTKTRLALFHVLGSPVRFFRSRMTMEPDWLSALSTVLLHVAIVSTTALVVLRKTRRAMAPALAQLGVSDGALANVADAIGVISIATSTATVFGLQVVAIVTLDLLFTQSGRSRRLVELTGLCYVTQIPWATVALALSLWVWDPEPLRLSPSVTPTDLPRVMSQYHEAVASSPLQVTLRLVGSYFAIWLVGLQGVLLRVVSGFSPRAAWVSAILLGVLFVGLPYALR